MLNTQAEPIAVDDAGAPPAPITAPEKVQVDIEYQRRELHLWVTAEVAPVAGAWTIRWMMALDASSDGPFDVYSHPCCGAIEEAVIAECQRQHPGVAE